MRQMAESGFYDSYGWPSPAEINIGRLDGEELGVKAVAVVHD